VLLPRRGLDLPDGHVERKRAAPFAEELSVRGILKFGLAAVRAAFDEMPVERLRRGLGGIVAIAVERDLAAAGAAVLGKVGSAESKLRDWNVAASVSRGFRATRGCEIISASAL
jgi:hypothetical protein